jgi:hypothetical protein
VRIRYAEYRRLECLLFYSCFKENIQTLQVEQVFLLIIITEEDITLCYLKALERRPKYIVEISKYVENTHAGVTLK